MSAATMTSTAPSAPSLPMDKGIILIGAGGHAKVVVQALESRGYFLRGYVDPTPAKWLDKHHIPHLSQDQLAALLPSCPQLAIGFLGLNCDSLKRRLTLQKDCEKKGGIFPPVLHRAAHISPSSCISPGAQVLTAAIIHPHATIGAAAVINTAAIIEHDATIGEGSHIAPRATVLGGASVGSCCFLGAGSVLIQGKTLQAHGFVKALAVAK